MKNFIASTYSRLYNVYTASTYGDSTTSTYDRIYNALGFRVIDCWEA